MFFGTESAWIEGFSQSAAERYGPWSTCIIFLRNGVEAVLAHGVDLVVGGDLTPFSVCPGFHRRGPRLLLHSHGGEQEPTGIWRIELTHNMRVRRQGCSGGGGGGHSFWFNLQNHLLGCHLKVVEFTGCLLMPHKQNGTTWHLIDRC